MNHNTQNALHHSNTMELNAFFGEVFLGDCTDFKLILVDGPDAKPFLQGQLTCDMNTVTLETTSLAAHCTAQGRVVATLVVIARTSGYFLRVPAKNAETLLTTLSKYAVFSKVFLTDVSEQFAQVNIMGPRCEALLAPFFSTTDSNQTTHLPETPYATAQNDSITLIRWPALPDYPELTRFLILGMPDAVQNFIAPLHKAISVIQHEAERLWDILAGIPNITPATSERFTPHMLNLDQLGAISFTKGCYIGQEIITRTQYKGTVKRRMKQVNLPLDVTKKENDTQATTIIDAVALNGGVSALVVMK